MRRVDELLGRGERLRCRLAGRDHDLVQLHVLGSPTAAGAADFDDHEQHDGGRCGGGDAHDCCERDAGGAAACVREVRTCSASAATSESSDASARQKTAASEAGMLKSSEEKL